MGKKPSVIEINGKRYDALTGQLIGAVKKAISPMQHPVAGAVLDGIKRGTRHLKQPAHTVHSRTQRSKTLMRSIVTKPPSKHFSAHKPAERQKPLHGEVLSSKQSVSAVALAPSPLQDFLNNVSQQKIEKMLDAALWNADAHKKALKARKIPIWLPCLVALLVLAVGGFVFAWNRIPQVSTKVASMKAHIKTAVPNYVPSGFKFDGPAKVRSGTIDMTFRSASDSRFFTIKQQASNWDSASLEANAIVPKAQVQTSQVKGTTVYIYDSKNNATWVNNGVHYTIDDHAQLNSEELLKIADSL